MVQGRLQCFWMSLVDIVVSPDFFLAGALFFIPFFFSLSAHQTFSGRAFVIQVSDIDVSVCLLACCYHHSYDNITASTL